MTNTENNNVEMKPWTTLESKELFMSKRLRLRQDTCQLPSKRVIDDYLVVEVPDGAAIIAITEQNQIVLVRQYKHGLGQMVLELPAGNVEKEEDQSSAVIRELQEETGFLAQSVEFICILATKPARMSAKTFVYLALDVKQTHDQEKSDMEVIETVLVPVRDLPDLIQRGDIITETSLAALLMVWHRLNP